MSAVVSKATDTKGEELKGWAAEELQRDDVQFEVVDVQVLEVVEGVQSGSDGGEGRRADVAGFHPNGKLSEVRLGAL